MTELKASAGAGTRWMGTRPLTLEPVIERDPLFVQVARVETSMAAGFRMDWISGTGEAADGETIEFDLTCGAGLGGRYLIMSIKHPVHGTIEEVVDMGKVAQRWVDEAIKAGATPKWVEPEKPAQGELVDLNAGEWGINEPKWQAQCAEGHEPWEGIASPHKFEAATALLNHAKADHS